MAEFPSQTAHLSQPYKNTGRNGDLLFDPKKFAELCIAADKAGLIIHVHAIGDGAVTEALNGIAAARKAKNFAEADRIRAELEAMGLALKDSRDPETGELVTTWEVRR